MVGDVLEGTVTRGIGEGALFMSMDHYKKEIKKKLGFGAFPGTLNIKTKENWKESLEKKDKIIIRGEIIIGKAVIRVPLLGYIKIWFVDILKFVGLYNQ